MCAGRARRRAGSLGWSADRPGDRTRHPRSAGRGPDRRRRGSFTSASLSEAPCRPRSSRRSSGGLPGWTARRSMLIEGPSSSGRPVPEERVRCDSGQLRSGRARVVTIRPRLWKGQDGGFQASRATTQKPAADGHKPTAGATLIGAPKPPPDRRTATTTLAASGARPLLRLGVLRKNVGGAVPVFADRAARPHPRRVRPPRGGRIHQQAPRLGGARSGINDARSYFGLSAQAREYGGVLCARAATSGRRERRAQSSTAGRLGRGRSEHGGRFAHDVIASRAGTPGDEATGRRLPRSRGWLDGGRARRVASLR